MSLTLTLNRSGQVPSASTYLSALRVLLLALPISIFGNAQATDVQAPAAPQIRTNGTLVGAWQYGGEGPPIEFNSDNGRTAHGVLKDGNRVMAILDGAYVAGDRIDFTIKFFDTQGCQGNMTQHWHIVGENRIEARVDPYAACGYSRSRAEEIITKLDAAGTRPSAQVDPLERILNGLAGISGGGGPTTCDFRDDYGRCESQSEHDADVQRAIQRGRSQ